jgi:hypothetical protein
MPARTMPPFYARPKKRVRRPKKMVGTASRFISQMQIELNRRDNVMVWVAKLNQALGAGAPDLTLPENSVD